MSDLERAYASNEQREIQAIRFIHSSFSGGSLDYVIGRESIVLDSVTYEPAAMSIQKPNKNTEGTQSLNISVSNADNVAYTQMKRVIQANRTSNEKVEVIYYIYLPTDLVTPANSYTGLYVNSSVSNRNSISVACTYAPIPNYRWPISRYYVNDGYSGVKYLNR